MVSSMFLALPEAATVEDSVPEPFFSIFFSLLFVRRCSLDDS